MSMLLFLTRSTMLEYIYNQHSIAYDPILLVKKRDYNGPTRRGHNISKIYKKFEFKKIKNIKSRGGHD